MVRFGQTARTASGKRSSLVTWPRLQKLQTISIAMTTVLPLPVAILQPSRVNGARPASAG